MRSTPVSCSFPAAQSAHLRHIDLFFFYAFHELALIPTFLLIGIWGSGNRVAAAWKITIYLAIGSFILLLGLILLYQSVPARIAQFRHSRINGRSFTGQIAADAQHHIYLFCLSALEFSFRSSRFTHGRRKLTRLLRRRRQCCMQEC